MTTNHAEHGDAAEAAPYVAPTLVDYGTIEEWTKGRSQPVIQISVII